MTIQMTPSSEALLRLRILEGLERVEGSSTRDTGTADLRRIINETVCEENFRIVLRLFFCERNSNILHKLIPLLIDISNKIPSRVVLLECSKYLIMSLRDPRNQSVVERTWKALLERNLVDPLTIFHSLSMTGRTDFSMRKGLANLLLRTVDCAFEAKNHSLITSILSELKSLHLSGQYQDLSSEIFESFSKILPVEINELSDSLPDLIADVIDFLDGKSKIKLCRPLALACCRFLIAVAQNTHETEIVDPFVSDVIHLLSRDNLRLLALTRSNPILRSAIHEALNAWKNLAPSLSTVDMIRFSNSPQWLTSEVKRPPMSVRMIDSPIKESEISFDDIKISPEGFSDSSRVLYDMHASPAASVRKPQSIEPSEPPLSAHSQYSQICCENIRFVFQELVSRLSVTHDTRMRTRIFDSILGLSKADEFPDNVNTRDVVELHSILKNLTETSTEARLLFQKFFVSPE